MPPIRVYADTSVFGGPFDVEFALPSRAFFEQVRAGRFRLVSSALVADEIESAPPAVRDLFDEIAAGADIAGIGDEALRLHEAYLGAGILGPASVADAIHVAIATVSECRAIVSWNFKHIVHIEKIARYNAVNTLLGFGAIAIHSPAEVIAYDKGI